VEEVGTVGRKDGEERKVRGRMKERKGEKKEKIGGQKGKWNKRELSKLKFGQNEKRIWITNKKRKGKRKYFKYLYIFKLYIHICIHMERSGFLSVQLVLWIFSLMSNPVVHSFKRGFLCVPVSS
jgi:hypothetical protein